MKRFILLSLIILTQCAFEYPGGWDLSQIRPQSIFYPGASATTNQTITVGQSGNTIVFNGTSNNTKFFLPASQVGLTYTFIGDVAKYMTIMPVAADIINFSTNTAGQGIQNTSAAIGDSIELQCFTVGKWSIKNRVGTWAMGV